MLPQQAEPPGDSVLKPPTGKITPALAPQEEDMKEFTSSDITLWPSVPWKAVLENQMEQRVSVCSLLSVAHAPSESG